VCKQPISKEKEEEVYWYCINPDCPAKIKQSLLHFSSRSCMDIESMGESAIAELVDRNLIKSLADVYSLKKEDLLKLPLFADKKADNLLVAIEKSKKQPLSRLIYGLGIRHIGEKTASLLTAKFNNIDNFFTLKVADLEETQEIGPVMANSIVNFFSLGQTQKLINQFKKAGLNLREEEKQKVKTAITGKTFFRSRPKTLLSKSPSLARIQLILPLNVLISPLWAKNLNGWAKFQAGKVFVLYRE